MSSAGHSRPRDDAPTSTTARYGKADTGLLSSSAGVDITSKAIALVIVAIIIAAFYYGFQYFRQQQESNAKISYVTHDIVSDDTLRVWSDVTRTKPDETAYCIVQAFDYDKNEVGRREFAVAPSDSDSIRIAVDIPTNARAVAGGVYGCSSDIPAYLDVDHPHYAESHAG